MSAIIGFDHFRVHCVIGVNPEERSQKQDLYLDLKVKADISRCIQTDALQDTIDYRQLADVCLQVAEQGNYQLLERYAHAVLTELLDSFAITWAWIRIKKPQALADSRYPFVELELSR